MILQRREFANYLRKNWSVKGDATSNQIHGACSAKIPRWQWRWSIVGFVMIQKKVLTIPAVALLMFLYSLTTRPDAW